jgi:prolycopene isomerase
MPPSSKDTYDIVVVGSGMGGLAAGASLARAGKSVVVVERHYRPGGYGHGFERGGFRFDVAVHMTSGAEPRAFGEGAFLHNVLEMLGVRDRCTFLPIDPLYAARFPDFRLDVPTGTSEFVEAHACLAPGDEAGMRDLVRLCIRINREIRRLPVDVASYNELVEPGKFPLVLQYAEATLADVLDDHVNDGRLKAVLGALWMYLGVPPSHAAFVRWAPMMLSYLEAGAFYCEGGFQNLANAFVDGLERHGGEIVLNASVDKIVVEDGNVHGVVLDDGRQISASVVVSNADATQTFERLVGPQHLPATFMQRLRRLKPSLSGITTYLATDLELSEEDVAHETFSFDSWDHDDIYRRILSGDPALIAVTVPTIVDPSVAPPGQHVVALLALVPYGLDLSSEAQQDRLLRRANEVIPGLSDHTSFAVAGSPDTMRKYTLNHQGALYGWEGTPAQSGATRLARTTPIDGLFLAGHWTQPGGGLLPVIVSGLQTAQLVLGYESVQALVEGLAGAA